MNKRPAMPYAMRGKTLRVAGPVSTRQEADHVGFALIATRLRHGINDLVRRAFPGVANRRRAFSRSERLPELDPQPLPRATAVRRRRLP